jgi:uncharacterized protein
MPSDDLQNGLYISKVYHKRHQPFEHDFTYNVFTLFCRLSDLKALSRNLKFFSYNRWNILSFYERDHGARDGTQLSQTVFEECKSRGFEIDQNNIWFLGFPRLWGYVFNPISILFCFDLKNNLNVIIYQVKNTFGHQLSYICPVTPDQKREDGFYAQECMKEFYVSPFIDMACDYKFHVRVPSQTLDFAIHQFQENGKILTATWNGNYCSLNDVNILKAVLTHPLMTLKVMIAIHWEALKLWIKGAPFHKVPPPPAFSFRPDPMKEDMRINLRDKE